MRGASWANMQSREKSVFSVIGEVGWYRRQRQRHKGPPSLAADARHSIAADLSAPHEGQLSERNLATINYPLSVLGDRL